MADDPGTSADRAAHESAHAAPSPEELEPRAGVDPILGAVQSLAPLSDSVDTLLVSVDRLSEASNEMQEVLARRSTLDRAVGILMGQGHCSAEAALDMLAAQARSTGRTVAEIAADTVAHAPDEAPGRDQ